VSKLKLVVGKLKLVVGKYSCIVVFSKINNLLIMENNKKSVSVLDCMQSVYILHT